MKLTKNTDSYIQKQLSMMPRFMEAEISEDKDSYIFSRKKTGQYLGSAKKTDFYRSVTLPIAIIDKSDNGYDVNIVTSIPPDHRTYYWVKDICQKTGQELPAYDARAYKDFIINRKKNMIANTMQMQ